jgi:hypothetical protein
MRIHLSIPLPWLFVFLVKNVIKVLEAAKFLSCEEAEDIDRKRKEEEKLSNLQKMKSMENTRNHPISVGDLYYRVIKNSSLRNLNKRKN